MFETLPIDSPSVETSIWVTVGVLVLYQLVVWVVRYRRWVAVYDGLPMKKKRHWFFGHMNEHPGPSEEGIKFQVSFTDLFPKFHGIWFGRLRCIIIVHHPDPMKTIMRASAYVATKPRDPGTVYKIGLNWLGEGLLIANGDRWARNRRLLTPAFHFDILQPYVKIANTCTDILLGKVEKFAESTESFEVFEHVGLCSLDIITRCAFSYHTDCQTQGEKSPYVKAVHRLTDLWIIRALRVTHAFDFIYFNFTKDGKEFLKLCKFVHDVSDDIIAKRRDTLVITKAKGHISSRVVSCFCADDKVSCSCFNPVQTVFEMNLAIDIAGVQNSNVEIAELEASAVDNQNRTVVSDVENLNNGVRGCNDWIPMLVKVHCVDESLIGRYVVVVYDGLPFPGLIEDVDEDEIEVKKMHGLPKKGEEGSTKRSLDFLDIILTARDEEGIGLNDLEIRNEVDTFLFEGHDTTTSAISFILYELAKHPTIQQECQREIDAVLEGRDTDIIEWKDLSKFEFLTQCIKEGMRLHSPVFFIQRQVTEDIDLEGYRIPAGTNIALDIYNLHHNRSVWGEDRDEFKPERFSPDRVKEIDPFAYLPFSAGQRNCIGQNFAMNELKVTISRLLHRFSFTCKPGHVVKRRPSVVMKTEDGIWVVAEKRK